MDPQETITITKAEYENMKSDLLWLNCLENAGVDNWNGYDYAVELFKELQDEEE